MITDTAVVVAATGVLVAAIAFVTDQIVRWRSDLSSRRRRAAAHVGIHVEKAVALRPWYPLSLLRSSQPAEVAFALIAVVGELPRRDKPIGLWLAHQVRAVQEVDDATQRTQLLVSVATRMNSWANGDTPRNWFVEENGKLGTLSPPVPDPKARRREAASFLGTLAACVAFVELIRVSIQRLDKAI